MGVAVNEIVAVRYAVRIGDDYRRALIVLGFDKCFDRLVGVCAHRNAGDINIAVAHHQQSQIFFAGWFAGRGELGNGCSWCGL